MIRTASGIEDGFNTPYKLSYIFLITLLGSLSMCCTTQDLTVVNSFFASAERRVSRLTSATSTRIAESMVPLAA